MEAETSSSDETMSKVITFRIDGDEKLNLEILTNQMKQKFGDAFTRSEVIKLGLVLLDELGVENLEMLVNDSNLEISIKRGEKNG